jgi:hypothetical protein
MEFSVCCAWPWPISPDDRAGYADGVLYGLSGPSGLSNVDLTTLIVGAIYARCFQASHLDRQKESGDLAILEACSFSIMSGFEPC